MFAIQSLLPEGGASLDAYPNPENQAQWVIKLKSLRSQREANTYADAARCKQILPASGAKLVAQPTDDEQWEFVIEAYDGSWRVREVFPPDKNLVTALVQVIQNPGATAVLGPILLDLFRRLPKV